MNELTAKVAYLHGLAEGLDLDTSSAEGRVLAAVIDVLDDIAEALRDVTEAQDELADYVEEMDEDLSGVEESLFVDPDENMAMEADVGNGVSVLCCPDCGATLGANAGTADAEEFDVTCPVCGCSLRAEDGGHVHN